MDRAYTPWTLLLLGALMADWICSSTAAVGRTFCVCVRASLIVLIATALVLVTVQTTMRIVTWGVARRRFKTSALARVTWVGHRLQEDESIEAVRDAQFGSNTTPYYMLLASIPQYYVIGLVGCFTLAVMLWAKLSGASTSAALLVAFVVLGGGAYALHRIFPARLRLGAGVLQICVGNRLIKQSVVWKEVPLHEARVVIWAIDPTLIQMWWYEGCTQKSLSIRNMPKEMCYYVLIAAITRRTREILPPPRLREPTRGPMLMDKKI